MFRELTNFQERVFQQLLNTKNIHEFPWIQEINWMMMDLEV